MYHLKRLEESGILVLDADEVIDKSDFPRVRALMKHPDRCYLMTQRHYSNEFTHKDFTPVTGKFPQWEEGASGYFETSLGRLFPNFCGISYENRIHELVEPVVQSYFGYHYSSFECAHSSFWAFGAETAIQKR